MRTQNTEVLRMLKRHKNTGITAFDAAAELDCWRLAARICDLRGQGHDIRTIMEPHERGRHARYFLRG